MNAPLLIGLAGPARSGKDTAAEIIGDELMSINIAFAEPIKKMLQALLQPGWPNSKWQPPEKEQPLPGIGKSYRQLAQTLGTEWGRDMVNPHLWVNMAMIQVDFWLKMKSAVTVSDVRFPNEAAAIRKRGGHLWHIRRLDAYAVAQHSSEQQKLYRPGDTIIDNNGTLDSLRATVMVALEDLQC